jgi:hypothetical protein
MDDKNAEYKRLMWMRLGPLDARRFAQQDDRRHNPR